LSELRPVLINPQLSPVGFDTNSSSAPSSDQLDNEEPVATTVAVASTNAEDARTRRARSLLTKLHHIFSTKAEPPPSSDKKAPSPPRLSSQPGDVTAAAIDVAAPPPTDAARAQPPRATPLLAERFSLISTNAESSPPIFEKKSSPPTVAGRLDNVGPGVKAVAVAAPAGAENARPQATSLLTEPRPLTSASTAPPPIIEMNPSRLTLSGRAGNVEPAIKTVGVAPSIDPESGRAQQATSLLVEPGPPSSTNIEPPSPRFGKGPSGPILSGRLDLENVEPAEKPDVKSAQPQQANSSLTELPPLISTITKAPPPFETEPSRPILSGKLNFAANAAPTDAENAGARQAKSFLVEQPPLISINREISTPMRDEKSHPTLSGQPDNLEPAAEIVAAAPPTDIESARAQKAESFLTELLPLISADTEPSPPSFQTEPSPPTLSARLENMASAASTVAPLPPTNVESARPQRLRWLLAELTPMISANPKPSVATSEKQPSRPTSSNQLKNLEPAAKTASVAPLTNSDSAVMQPREAKRLLCEILSLDSNNTEPQPFIFENESSPIFLSGQPDHGEPAAKIVAAAPLPDAEDARPQQGKSLLAELPPSRFFFERKPSPATLSGELDNVGPAVKTVATTPPTHAVTTQQQTKSLPLTDLPARISNNTKSSFPIFEQDSPPPSLSGQPDSVGPSPKSVVAAHPTEVEDALPQHVNSLLAALRVLNAKPSPPILAKEPSRSTLASQPDNAGMSVKTVVVAHPTDAESALARQAKSLLTEMPALTSTNAKPSPPIFEKEPSRPPVSDQPANVEPTAKAVAVAPPADTESAVTRAQQAKSLLAELDLNTAIRLRWVMRDIRSKRTKLSPVSDNDLTALMDLGLVEMREELPRLTALGVLALD
jgi:hypothetical protein